MGGTCSRKKPLRFLLMGLDAAGKTSLLYRMKIGQIVTTIPTIGFNVETLSYKGIEITGWDVGGRDKIRPLYRHYYANTDAVIYVIDSNDRERIDYAIKELKRFVLESEELEGAVVMVLANKQDLKSPMAPADIEDELRRKCIFGFNMTVFVMPCSVTTGDGMWEAFDRFVSLTKEKQETGKVPVGLIPQDWNKQTSRQEQGLDAERSQAPGEQKESMSAFHTLKNSWLKDPFGLLKSILFY